MYGDEYVIKFLDILLFISFIYDYAVILSFVLILLSLFFFLQNIFWILCQFLYHQGKLNPFIRGTSDQIKAVYNFQVTERSLLLGEQKCTHSPVFISSTFMCQVLFQTRGQQIFYKVEALQTKYGLCPNCLTLSW